MKEDNNEKSIDGLGQSEKIVDNAISFLKEEIEDDLVALVLSKWLPYGTGRKIAMFLVFILGLCGAIVINKLVILVWLVLPFFSPRIAGYVAIFFGKISKK